MARCRSIGKEALNGLSARHWLTWPLQKRSVRDHYCEYIPGNNYSTRILQKKKEIISGYQGTVIDPEDGEVWEWEYERHPLNASDKKHIVFLTAMLFFLTRLKCALFMPRKAMQYTVRRKERCHLHTCRAPQYFPQNFPGKAFRVSVCRHPTSFVSRIMSRLASLMMAKLYFSGFSHGMMRDEATGFVLSM